MERWSVDESSRALCSLNVEPEGGAESFLCFPLWMRIHVVLGAVMWLPGDLSFLTRWRASVTEVSSRQLVCQPETQARLSLVISSAVFNLAVFFRDPPSLSFVPILIVTTGWVGGWMWVGLCFTLPSGTHFFFFVSLSAWIWGRETVHVTMGILSFF